MKILIVEDEPNIRNGIINILQMNLTIPYKIKSCGNVIEALNMCEFFIPDLTITDIVMPDQTGLELIKILKKNNYCQNFIVISGYDNFSYAQQAIRYGVIDYLLKPIEKDLLLEHIYTLYNTMHQTPNSNLLKPLTQLDFFQWDLDSAKMPASLKQIIQYINKNYMNDISLNNISDELFFHTSYISTLINKYTGHSFTYLLDYIRIRKAAELLLLEKDLSIAEISEIVGYKNERRLYAAFQKRLHTTPGDFRKLYHN